MRLNNHDDGSNHDETAMLRQELARYRQTTDDLDRELNEVYDRLDTVEAANRSMEKAMKSMTEIIENLIARVNEPARWG
jgi:chromosome segregation ATPase